MVIIASAGVYEKEIDYTDCTTTNASLSQYGNCSQYFLSNPNASLTFSTCSCSINFTLEKDYQVPLTLLLYLFLSFVYIIHYFTCVVKLGSSIYLLRPEQLLPEPPQVRHFSRRLSAQWQNYRPDKVELFVCTFRRQ